MRKWVGLGGSKRLPPMQTTSINYAPITKRILAALIDYSLFLLLCYTYLTTFGTPEIQQDGSVTYVVDGFLTLTVFVGWFMFFPILEGTMGQTFGKKILNLKVVLVSPKYDYGIIDALKRHLTDIFELGFFGIPALISIKNTQHRQRFGDLWAKSIVVSIKLRPHAGRSL